MQWGTILSTLALSVFFTIVVKVVVSLLKWYTLIRVMSNIPHNGLNIPFAESLQFLWYRLIHGWRQDGQVALFKMRIENARRFLDKGIHKTSIGLDPAAVLFRPETVEFLLSSPTLLTKSPTYSFVQTWLGKNGVLMSTGERWRRHRKLLTPTFHFRILEDFIPIMNEHSQVFVEKLRDYVNKPFVDIVPLITLCTLDIICETAMGIKLNSQKDESSPYLQAVKKFISTSVKRGIRPWQWPDIIYRMTPAGKSYYDSLATLHAFTQRVIQQRKSEILDSFDANSQDKSSGRRRLAFLDLVLTHHCSDDSFTEDDVRQEVDTFMFAGHDTTATGVMWCLYLLGLHPEIQEKLHDELDRIFGKDKTRHATAQDIKDMKYLEQVMKESQRIYPSVPQVSRTLTEDLQIGEYRIPKDSICRVFMYGLYRNEDIFPHPENFDPDRFDPQNSIGRHPYAFIPFSAGPRNCIGQRFAFMEEKIVLSTVLRNYAVESLDPRNEVEMVSEIVLRPKDKIRLKLTPRNIENSL